MYYLGYDEDSAFDTFNEKLRKPKPEISLFGEPVVIDIGYKDCVQNGKRWYWVEENARKVKLVNKRLLSFIFGLEEKERSQKGNWKDTKMSCIHYLQSFDPIEDEDEVEDGFYIHIGGPDRVPFVTIDMHIKTKSPVPMDTYMLTINN